MKILAIDTTAKTAFVALGEFSEYGDPKIIAEYTLETGTHSTTLLPMIESALALTSNKISDIDFFAVSAGPGSFTGVRIGVATVKGLAFVNSTPCVGVSSIDALAYGCAEFEGIIAPAIDARRETVYSAVYFSDGKGKIDKLIDDAQVSFVDLLSSIEEKYPDKRVYMPGDAYKLYAEKYIDRMKNIFPCKDRAGIGAAIMAVGIWNSSDDKSAFTDSALVPMYLKKSQAERERDEMLASLGSKK